ncbi:hypothetical protein CRG98_045626 [Punica granatum]|uniref:Uncharacterized protein n=1 Tax=Punica granatum TaxID=22663 RepID=A0A2I0HQM4_PUNGR|nr:hypothetical protein CRG98_045626 [Punica granatum]
MEHIHCRWMIQVGKGDRDRGTAAVTAFGRRFSPLDAAMKVRMDAGDSSGHRRHSAVVDRDLTGA